MLIPVTYGLKTYPINIDEQFVKCPHCGSNQMSEILVSSTYYHFCFIPILPTGKDAMVSCNKCGLKRYGVPFDANLYSNYSEIKHNFRHKWFLYSGLMIILSPVIFTLIYFIYESLK